MTDIDKSKVGKVTLDIEYQDLLKIVSKVDNRGPISETLSEHDIEGEDLKKAWFKHMLLSMEKLNDLVESLRRVDLSNLKQELKEEINKVAKGLSKTEELLRKEIIRIDKKAEKAEDELKEYKKDVIDPINNKVITIGVKLGMWGVVGGCIGTGIVGLIFFIFREYVIKPSITGGP